MKGRCSILVYPLSQFLVRDLSVTVSVNDETFRKGHSPGRDQHLLAKRRLRFYPVSSSGQGSTPVAVYEPYEAKSAFPAGPHSCHSPRRSNFSYHHYQTCVILRLFGTYLAFIKGLSQMLFDFSVIFPVLSGRSDTAPCIDLTITFVRSSGISLTMVTPMVPGGG